MTCKLENTTSLTFLIKIKQMFKEQSVYEAIFNFPVYLNNLKKIWKLVQTLYFSRVDYFQTT